MTLTVDGLPVFDDGKAPDALRTIGEVAKALGIRQHVLRYWEEQFPTLKPVKRSGGRRYYRPEDVKLIVMIDRLIHQEGYTLRGARLAIAGGPRTDAVAAPEPTPQAASARPDILADLLSIRSKLAKALETA